MPIAICVILYHRVKLKMGLGVRSLQFLAVAVVPPLILILALEAILKKGAIAAVIGALIGYLLSNIGEYDRSEQNWRKEFSNETSDRGCNSLHSEHGIRTNCTKI